MALELRQQLKLAQQLIMTPQLQQAIKLLQMSRLELVETVQRELLENPFLEEGFEDNQDTEPKEVREQKKDGEGDNVYDGEIAKGADWEEYMGEFASSPRNNSSREYESLDEMSSIEARYTEKPNLDAHLLWQLRLSSQLTETQKYIGEIIIGNLSSSGYLQASIEDIMEMSEQGSEEIEEVLSVIQFFDPIGVAARSPKECLLIQLRSLNYDRDPILVSLVNDHLEDLENKRYKPILRKFHLTMEDLAEYLDIIQSLEPLPGASFGGEETAFVSPDVFVYEYGGEFVIILNDDGLPHLQLSSTLTENIEALNSDDKEYCSEKMRAASWLIKSLYQRQRTLYKVVESIIKYQRPFFEQGVSMLAPLILKDIADDIAMHESTVSRITSNKYVATPHGTFELKFFFNSALALADGSQVGSESVKALIKKFIADEDPKSPLSDERIGEMLKEHLNVNIARRTVAKYRTAMDIASSSRRKEHF